MQDPLLFSLTVLAVLATPGPTNTLLATSSSLVGVRRSLPLIPAELAGYLIAIGVLHTLLGGLLSAHPEIKTAFRVAVAIYLCAIAHHLWTRRGATNAQTETIGFRRVFVTTLLNPKAVVFAFGILPLSQPDWMAYVAAFAALVVAVALGWLVVVRWLGRAIGTSADRTIPRVSAVVLACFAGAIAFG